MVMFLVDALTSENLDSTIASAALPYWGQVLCRSGVHCSRALRNVETCIQMRSEYNNSV